MSVLHERAEQYVAMRRSLGYKFISQARMLAGFADYLAARGDTTVTVTAALAWATAPDPASAAYHRQRLSVVRGFARHLAAFDPSCQVPPAGLLPPAEVPAPYLYSPQEISALIHAAGTLAIPIQAATCHALILYRSRTWCRLSELRFGTVCRAGHDRGSCLSVCCTCSWSGCSAGWSCWAGAGRPRTPRSWCCGMR